MKVNGSVFRKAREEIRKNSLQNSNKLRGAASEGTQEWLAAKAKIRSKNGNMTSLSVRTIQYLEKGEASIQVVDAVSPFLGINGRELILGYGKSSIEINSLGVIDFRPVLYPPEGEEFYHSTFLMSIDPLMINFSSDDIDTVMVNNMTIKLTLGNININFKWLYDVSLTPNGNGWLGIEKEVSPFEMESPKKYKSSIMFKQSYTSQVSWVDFLEGIENQGERLIQIILNVDFITFTKELKIGVSTSQAKRMIEINKKLKRSKYPFYIQPDALTWK